ncbi:MAG: hypothetical protein WAY02_09425 [Burkholderiaceae bacterium]
MPLNLAPYGWYGRSLLGDPSIPPHLWQYQPTETAHDPDPPLTLSSGGAATVTMAPTTLAGVGALTASPIVIVIAAATGAAATGALTASSIVVVPMATTTATGVGAFSASPTVVVPMAATGLDGTGALSAITAVIVVMSATDLAGAGALSASTQVLVFAAATAAAGVGALAADALVVAIADPTAEEAIGALSSVPIVAVIMAATDMAGAGALAADPIVTTPAVEAARGASVHRPPRSRRREEELPPDPRPRTVRAGAVNLTGATALTSSAIIIVAAEIQRAAMMRSELRCDGRLIVPGDVLMQARMIVSAAEAEARIDYTADEELLELLVMGV